MLIMPTVVVVGYGFAGLMAAHEAGRHGAHVVMVDKALKGGGNSVKASSGLSAAKSYTEVSLFVDDIVKGGGGVKNLDLVTKLAQDSPRVLEDLAALGLPLPKTVLLGGHSAARTRSITHHGGGQSVGAFLHKGLDEVVRKEVLHLKVLLGHSLEQICLNPEGEVEAVMLKKVASCRSGGASSGDDGRREAVVLPSGEAENNEAENNRTLIRVDTRAVVIATGGWAGSEKALGEYSGMGGQARGHGGEGRHGEGEGRHGGGGQKKTSGIPLLLRFATSNSNQANDDGAATGLSVAMKAGAATIDLEKVQLHPTGFIDPHDPGQI
jgi:succinate dehydrogenase/fumarate reductase flavoprotein subunit